MKGLTMTDKTPAERFRERMRAFGFKQIVLYVHEDEADLMQAEASLKQAQHFVELIDRLRVSAEGIDDERFDTLLGVELKGVPSLDTVIELTTQAETKDEKRECEKLRALVYEHKTLQRQAVHAAERYEAAPSTEKFDAGLEWRIALARVYAYGKLLKASVKYYKVKFGMEAFQHDRD